MVLIFYAFSRELAHLRRLVRHRAPLPHPGLRGFAGTLGSARVTCVATGIGAQRARLTALTAIAAVGDIELVISSGVAGALSEGLHTADIIVADRLLYDYGKTPGMLALGDQEVRQVKHALRAASLNYASGALLTSGRVLPDAAAKRQAKERSGAIAVDMESAAIGLEVTARKLKFCCLRTVLDEVDDELLGAAMVDGQGRVQALRAARFLLSHPNAALKLPGLMRGLGRATKALSGALTAVTSAL